MGRSRSCSGRTNGIDPQIPEWKDRMCIVLGGNSMLDERTIGDKSWREKVTTTKMVESYKGGRTGTIGNRLRTCRTESQ